MDKFEIKKIILWGILSISILIGILKLFPIIGYILITMGIIIPSYILYKNYYDQ